MEKCTGIAHPFIAEGGLKKHVGTVPCPGPECPECYLLWVGCNLGAVPITCSPIDDLGRGNGTTAFQRVYTLQPGVTVHLVAPAVLGNYTFTAWRLNDVLYVYDTAVDIPMQGECQSAFAIYGPINTVFPGGGGCGGQIMVPEFITITGTFAISNNQCVDQSPCVSLVPGNTIWANVRHSALCRQQPGQLSWGSDPFPWGQPPDPQSQTPECIGSYPDLPCPPSDALDFQDCPICYCQSCPGETSCSTCCAGGGPDPCNAPLFSPHGSSWLHACGAHFFANIECACVQLPDDPGWWLRANVQTGLGMYWRRHFMCSGGGHLPPTCGNLPLPFASDGGDVFVNHYRGRFEEPAGCAENNHLLLGGYSSFRNLTPCHPGAPLECYDCSIGTQFVI